MHTKGSATRYIKDRLKLDSCICLGNDLNDISMFSEAIKNDDFIVIANCEDSKITNIILDYLKKECELKEIDWEKVKLLVLSDKDVNKFLFKMNRVLGNIKNSKKPKQKNKRVNYKETNTSEMLKQKGRNRRRKEKGQNWKL